MKNAKLLTYLQSLSKKEIRLFDDFVLSPFHNKSELIIQLWKYIKPYLIQAETESLDKSLVIEYLYNRHTPNTLKRFNDLSVACCKLFEQFLQVQQFNKNKYCQEQLLINAFGERRMDKSFYKTIDTAKKKIAKKVVKDIQDYQQLLFLDAERLSHVATSKFDLKDTSMQNILDLSDTIAVMQKMKHTFEARQIELFVNKSFEISPINLDIQQVIPDENNLLLKIYAKQVELLNEPKHTDEVYQELKSIYFTNIDLLKKSKERVNTLNFLINITALKINKGNVAYYPELFELTKVGIEKRMLVKDGYINKGFIQNTCITASELGYIDWLNAFVTNDKNFNLVIKEQRAIVKTFCNILLLYAKKEFETILTNLNIYELDSLDLQFWSRTMELRCLFELYKDGQFNLENLIDARLEAFRRYCYRTDVLDKRKVNSNLNFIKTYTRLFNEEALLKSEKTAFKTEIKTMTTVCKLWLLRKAEVL